MTQPQPTEKDFQRAVLDLCRIWGYEVAHFRPARTQHGWRTPVAAQGKGLPDLLISGHGRTFMRELKTTCGRLSPEQTHWIDHLNRNAMDAQVWRPDQWPEIIADLNPNEQAAA